GVIHTPGGCKEVAMQADHHDYEALQPHADQYIERDQEQPCGVRPDLLDPQNLRDDDVSCDQTRVAPEIGTMYAIPNQELVIGIASVPRHKEFYDVSIRDDEAGRQHDHGGVFQVAQRDKILQLVEIADGNRQDKHHGKARIDGASDEV